LLLKASFVRLIRLISPVLIFFLVFTSTFSFSVEFSRSLSRFFSRSFFDFSRSSFDIRLALYSTSFAQGFEGALETGKSLGRQDVLDFNPQNIDQTLQQRGLGSVNQITPRSGDAQGQQESYGQYYTNPGGMSGAGSGEAGEFVESSYEQRQKFDLSRDSTFGSGCLQRGEDGRCLMWSSSRDLITNTYPDCEKVVIPRYGETREETCTEAAGTGAISNYDCEIRSVVSIITEDVQGPCDQVVIEHKPGQVYAVCRDYVVGYRVFKQQLSCYAGHYKYVKQVLCNGCGTGPSCDYCFNAACPNDFYVVNNESELPAGAQLLGKGVGNVTVTGDSGSRVAHGSLSDYYSVRESSVIERVIVSWDSTCGNNLERWLRECAIQDYQKCDSNGFNCVYIIRDGEATGQTVANQCQTFESSIEGYQTRNCQDVCDPLYNQCSADCINCPGCATCEDARNVCRGNCDDTYNLCGNLCTSNYNSCLSGCGANQSCRDNCANVYNSCQANCEGNRDGCYGNCEGDYQTCRSCVSSCRNQFCREQCETVTVNSNYQICSPPESSQGIEINEALATKTLYRHVFTTTHRGLPITWQTILGGPEVKEMLNDWWSKVRFACGEETENCKVLEEQGCVYYSHRCLNQGCTQVEYTYRCGQGGILGYTVAYNCLGQVRCMGTECVDASYDANTDFASATAAIEVLNQYRVDSKGMSIFPGHKAECVRTEGCCNSATGGVSIADYVSAARSVISLYGYATGGYATTWAGYANAFTYVLTTGEAGSMSGLLGTTVSDLLGTTTSTLWTSTGTISGEAAVHIGAEVAIEGAATTVAIDTALISTLATLATVITIVLVVYSIVKFLWDWYFGCDKKDIITSQKVNLRLCHRVGERCCKKLLGMCTKHCRVYCCFNSILARLVHEQGRPQVGIPWGGVNNPNCRGFTPEELGSLDFSRIDLTEYMQYIKHKTEVSPQEMEEISNRVKQRYIQ